MRIARVAERVGYGSASTFSTEFSRHVGQAPSRCTRGRKKVPVERLAIMILLSNS